MTRQAQSDILEKKLSKGMKLAYKKLLLERAKEDGYLIISQNGKIIKKKAREILKEISKKKKV